VVNAGPVLAEVDTLSSADTWDAWIDLRNNGLGPYMPTAKFMVEAALQHIFRVMVGGLVVAGAGLAMAIVSMLLPGTQGSPPRKK
jgi:hypothetical protein